MIKKELENAKKNINYMFNDNIKGIHELFIELENVPIKSFNSKKREMRDNIIRALKEINKRIQIQLT